MIPGTTKETAALANARAKLVYHQSIGCYGGRPETWASVREAQRKLKLAERRELVAAGKLPGSSALPHNVALAVDLVRIAPSHPEPCNDVEVIYQGVWHGELRLPVHRALNDTVNGRHELWFDAEGNAFLSFEHEEDATLFRLALDA